MRSILPSRLLPGNPPSGFWSLGAGYWSVAALANAAAFVWPTTLAGLLPGIVAVAAIGIGVARNGPARRWPWTMVAIAIGAWAIGDQVYADLIAEAGGVTDQLDVVTLLGMLYLLSFIALSGALLRLRRSPGNGLAPAGLLDTMSVTLVLSSSSGSW
jgi:hypothetical protein